MNQELMDTIIRAVLPDKADRLHYVQERVSHEAFSGAHRDLWNIICSVYELTNGSILDARALSKILEAQPEEKLPLQAKIHIEELWERLAQMPPVTEPDFRVSVEYLLDKTKESALGSVLDKTAKIIDHGLTEGKLRMFGVNDALNYLQQNVYELDYRHSGSAPEADVRTEAAELMDELHTGSSVTRISVGMVPIDEMTHGGVGEGELWIIGAYTGVGKSLMAINFAHSLYVQGRNVLYFALEMPRKQVRRRLMVRHASGEQFGMGGVSLTGLNNNRPNNPSLTDEEVARYTQAVKDFTENPAYGRIPIIELPENTKLSTIRAIAKRWNQKAPVDAIIIDSLDLVGADTKRQSRRDELNEVIIGAKRMAMAFEGRSIPIITPWQTSRDAFRHATSDFSDGSYGITALAETSEAERRADLIITLMQKPDTPSRLKVQTLKWRDGTPRDFELKVNYDHCFMGSSEPLNSFGGLDLYD